MPLYDISKNLLNNGINMELRKQKIIYSVYILLILFSIYAYGIKKVCCFTLFPDEFGYWASAANMAGYDWSGMTALGYYYSFGYGFVLFPILKLFPDGIAAYRAAIGLNMILMGISFWLIQEIIKELFPKTDEVERAFLGGIAIFYPSWIFYMQMTMTEALLMFLFTVLIKLLIFLIKNPGNLAAAVLALLLSYMYSVHMRMAGPAISCVIVLLLWGKERPDVRKYIVVFLVTLLLAGGLAVWYKQYTILEVFPYVGQKALKTNNYGGIWGKFTELFSSKGIIHFDIGLLGKIFYIGLASFGFAIWGIIGCLKETAVFFRKKEAETSGLHNWIAVFMLLAAGSEILISTIYMVREENIDSLIYGRYIDFLVPVLMIIGICTLKESRNFIKLSLIWGFLSGAIAILLLVIVEKERRTGLRGYMTVGMSQFIREASFEPRFFFLASWIFGIILFLVLGILIKLSSQKENMGWLMGCFIMVEVVLGLYASHHYTYQYNETHFVDKAVAETIRGEGGENASVVYLKEDETRYIQAVQMMLGEQKIEVVEEEDFFAGDSYADFLLTVSWSANKEELKKMYERSVEVNTFILFYNPEKIKSENKQRTFKGDKE